MPNFGSNGKLVKLRIESYAKQDCQGKPLDSIEAFINPETYTRNFAIDLSEIQVTNDSQVSSNFWRIGQPSLTLSDIVVDGTGIIPLPKGITSVDKYIEKFKNIVYTFEGSEHRPPYVKLIWGSLSITGVCTNYTVKYLLLNLDGSALRASINITVKENPDIKTKIAEAAKNSPDLTHKRIVNAGDTLPLMSYRIYGDSAHYYRVAKYNKLESVYAIKPGDEISFPPLKKLFDAS